MIKYWPILRIGDKNLVDNDPIIELEVRLTYLEDGLATLDKVVIEQANSIDYLTKTNKALIEQIRNMREQTGMSDEQSHELPPHY